MEAQRYQDVFCKTEFGDYAYDGRTGKILWADIKVWENLPHLISGGMLYYASPDGYLLEPIFNTYPNPYKKRVLLEVHTMNEDGITDYDTDWRKIRSEARIDYGI
jgi:hypothetical protein